jgi:hypothetical protein
VPEVTDENKVTPYQVEMNLRKGYLATRRGQDARVFDCFSTLLGQVQRSHVSLGTILQEAADLGYVMIGLRDQDGKYRYAYMSGMRADSWAAHRKKVYTLDSFSLIVDGWYSAATVSDLTRVYLEEKNPLGPGYEDSVNRPALLSMRRATVESSLEADFFNTLIKGSRDELFGWIEYAGTVGGKLPDAAAIRSIEVVSSILAVAITAHSRARRLP